MGASIVNELGTIHIEKEVLARIAYQAAMESYGLVGMTSKNSSGITELLSRSNGSKGVRLQIIENVIDLELFVIIQYGTNISVVADNIIDKVKYSLESQTGLKVGKVEINVQGIRVQK